MSVIQSKASNTKATIWNLEYLKPDFHKHLQAHCKVLNGKIFTRNWDGVSSVLKSEEEDIPSSRVSKNTFWKSSISGRLPNKDSICEKHQAMKYSTLCT